MCSPHDIDEIEARQERLTEPTKTRGNYYELKFMRQRMERPTDWLVLPEGSICKLVRVRSILRTLEGENHERSRQEKRVYTVARAD